METVYRITVEDVQDVAKKEIERELTAEEIKFIEDLIAERISWYDVIADVIAEEIKP